jgi:hypothetical protein
VELHEHCAGFNNYVSCLAIGSCKVKDASSIATEVWSCCSTIVFRANERPFSTTNGGKHPDVSHRLKAFSVSDWLHYDNSY